jgi:hypothetical protein
MRFDWRPCSLYVLSMAAANASVRNQRSALLAGPLKDLTGFYLAVDCLTPGCSGAQLRHRRSRELLRPGLYRRAGAAPNALFPRLRRPGRRGVAGYRPEPECADQAAAGAAAGPEAKE